MKNMITIKCSGKWVSGSGGHRIHEPCEQNAAWWHPDDCFAYCEQHLEPPERLDYLPITENLTLLFETT